MKHLKNYKIFEAQTDEHHYLEDILQEFFDEYGFVKFDRVKHRLMLSSQKLGLSVEISDGWCLGSKCLLVRFTDGGGRGRNIKTGVYKEFDGFEDKKMANDLKECHDRIVEYLNPVHVEVGSLGVHTRDLDMVYFKEKPDLKRYGEVEIYGSNVAIRLDELNHWLFSNSRHDNGFDVFDDRWNIVAMPYLKGYSDPGWFYYGPGEIMDRGDETKPIVIWINNEWDKICKKLNIKSYQKIRTKEKITVPEFMTHLKNNQ